LIRVQIPVDRTNCEIDTAAPLYLAHSQNFHRLHTALK